MKSLVDFCIEEETYLSPSNLQIEYPNFDFQLKSMIFPEDLEEIKDGRLMILENIEHHCDREKHYFNNNEGRKPEISEKSKTIEWMQCIFMDNYGFRIHEQFYDRSSFTIDFLCEK